MSYPSIFFCFWPPSGTPNLISKLEGQFAQRMIFFFASAWNWTSIITLVIWPNSSNATPSIIHSRNCWWKCQDDPWYDLDHYSSIRHPGHFRWRNDRKGRSFALVPEKNCPLQECQCAKFPYQVGPFSWNSHLRSVQNWQKGL